MTETDDTLERMADEPADPAQEPSVSFLLEEVDEEQEDAGDGLELDDRQSDEIRRIFAATLPQYLEPVEEMTAQVLKNGAAADTIEALQGTLSSLTVAATRVGFDPVVESLTAFVEQIKRLSELDGEAVPQEVRETILGDLIDLKDLARELGGDDAEQPESAGTIYQALRDCTDLDQSILPRLSAAGLTRVEQLTMANPDEIAAVTGLDLEVVAQLLRRVTGEPEPEPSQHEDVSAGTNVEELSLDPGDLRRVLEQKLRQQVEAEAAIEELRAEIGRQRAEKQEQREALRAARQAREALRVELAETTGELRQRRACLTQVEVGRRGRLRRYESAAEEVKTQEFRLQRVKSRLERITQTDEALGDDVEALTTRVKRLLSRVGKQRETVDSIGGRGTETGIKSDH
jgi:hypothetical protein